jgi:hypothetical protein
MQAITLPVNGRMMHIVITVVPALLPVAFKNTWRKGYPVGDFKSSSKSPIVKIRVMTIMNPRKPLA